MSRITKMTAEVLAESCENKKIFESTSDKFKNHVGKFLTIGFLAVCSSVSSGIATAQDYTIPQQSSFQLDVTGFLNNIFNDNTSPTNNIRMSDVPSPCNQLNSYTSPREASSLSVDNVINLAKSKEVNRLVCGEQVYKNANITAPKYRSNSAIDKNYILYEVRDYTGRYTQITYGNSPAINKFKLGGGDKSVDSNMSLKSQLDLRAKNLVLAHEELNRISRDYVNLAYGTDTPEYYRTRYDQNRQQSIYIQQRFLEQSFDVYAKARTDFMSMADSAAISDFNLTPYSKMIDYVSPPESLSQSYKSSPPNKYGSVSPGAFKY